MAVAMCCGTYTRHSRISGVVEPVAGLARVYAPQAGVVTELRAREGDVVKKGQILLIAKSERRSNTGADVHSEIGQQTASRLAALEHELDALLNLSTEDKERNRQQLASKKKTVDNLRQQIGTQTLHLEAAEATVRQFDNLKSAGYVTGLQLTQQQSALFDQKIHLDALQNELIATEAEVDRLERERASLPLKLDMSRAQLERDIATTRAEISQNAGDNAWSVVAPEDGTVSSVSIVPGQSTVSGVALMAITPGASALQARLYAPSRAIGFLHPGEAVHLKIDAFPFQKFGAYTGRVLNIAEAPTPPNEFSSTTTLTAKDMANKEPLYSIVVKLDGNTVTAYGQQERLKSGMQLEAEVELDRRKLYEWLLEPLHTLGGT
nr:HlyD family efflux transporter periplasmic adaptor subunit [Duganella radicis]